MRVHVLTDQEATREAIINKLIEVGSSARPNDLILIYFAGHCVAPSADKDKGRYLMAFDSSSKRPEATGIERGDVSRILDRAEAKRQVVLLDCCFSGAEDIVERGVGMESDPFGSLGANGECARAVLTAAKGNETAIEVADRPTSPFVEGLMKALSGRASEVDRDNDRIVTVGELHDYLYMFVAGVARSVGKEMHPQVYGPLDVPIGRLPSR